AFESVTSPTVLLCARCHGIRNVADAGREDATALIRQHLPSDTAEPVPQTVCAGALCTEAWREDRGLRKQCVVEPKFSAIYRRANDHSDRPERTCGKCNALIGPSG